MKNIKYLLFLLLFFVFPYDSYGYVDATEHCLDNYASVVDVPGSSFYAGANKGRVVLINGTFSAETGSFRERYYAGQWQDYSGGVIQDGIGSYQTYYEDPDMTTGGLAWAGLGGPPYTDGNYFIEFSRGLIGCYVNYTVIGGQIFIDYIPDQCLDGESRICLTSPFDGEVLSSTSSAETVLLEGYVNSDDIDDSDPVYFEFNFYRNQNRLAVGPLFAFSGFAPNSEIITIEGGTGYNFISTSTSAFTQIGKYTGKYIIKTPYFSFLGINLGSKVLDSESITFVVGTSTAIEQLIDDAVGEDGFLLNATSTNAVKALVDVDIKL